MLPYVSNNEILSRFIVYSRWIRQNRTIRPDAFMPDSSLETSVTRHLGISEQNIWKAGELAIKPPRKLLGRGDIEAKHIRKQGLDVAPNGDEDNPNHANIVDWPEEKDAQKIHALAIASAASFVTYLGPP